MIRSEAGASPPRGPRRARKESGGVEFQRHGGVANLKIRRRPFDSARVDLEARDAAQQLCEDHAPFETRYVNPDAVMQAVAEAQVADGAPVNVEVIGALELALVAVGGLQQQKDPLTGRDPPSTHDDLAERGAPHGLQHSLVANQLLEGAGDERRIACEVLALVRMAAQLESAARQNLRQGLGRAHEQGEQLGRDLVVPERLAFELRVASTTEGAPRPASPGDVPPSA